MLELEVFGNVVHQPTEEDLRRASNTLGLDLPASYREFVSKYGYGATARFFTIWVPTASAPPECRLDYMSPLHAEELRDIAREPYLTAVQDIGADIPLRLVPFGTTDNGDYLAWDPRSGEGGEYSIAIVGSKGSSAAIASNSLLDLIATQTDERTAPKSRLPAIFEAPGEKANVQYCTTCDAPHTGSHSCSGGTDLAHALKILRTLVDQGLVILKDERTIDDLAMRLARFIVTEPEPSDVADWLMNDRQVHDIYVDDEQLGRILDLEID